ncbi:MAG: hypothetical protein HY785_18655 [Oscillatoriophycideae cyanobacterium NC_groundwater_1537_Pr4_S-0.65um_50_18]|nr:hypothetical protein [Oscillatoriophycideae cyanobacterium NC_groundwater_1537_Pr4_S-0.65um_50_18]
MATLALAIAPSPSKGSKCLQVEHEIEAIQRDRPRALGKLGNLPLQYWSF